VFDQRLDSPLQVYTQQATIDALHEHVFNGVIWPDFTRLPDAEDPVIRFRAINPGDTIRVKDRDFLAVAVQHSVPTVGFLIRVGHRHVGFSGDTGANTTLWKALNAAPTLDALIVDVSFPNSERPLAEHSGHYCPATLAEDLAFLHHEAPIWLTAMKPGFEARILEEVREALPNREVRRLMDGDELRL
jgi:cAMP phosphodiesterase